MELTPLVPALYIRLIPVQDCKANFSTCRVIRLKELTPSVPNLYIHDLPSKGLGVGEADASFAFEATAAGSCGGNQVCATLCSKSVRWPLDFMSVWLLLANNCRDWENSGKLQRKLLIQSCKLQLSSSPANCSCHPVFQTAVVIRSCKLQLSSSSAFPLSNCSCHPVIQTAVDIQSFKLQLSSSLSYCTCHPVIQTAVVIQSFKLQLSSSLSNCKGFENSGNLSFKLQLSSSHSNCSCHLVIQTAGDWRIQGICLSNCRGWQNSSFRLLSLCQHPSFIWQFFIISNHITVITTLP